MYVRVNYSIDYNDEYIDIDLKIENEKFTKILDRVSRIYTKEELKHQFILNFMEQYIYYSYASLKQFEKEKTIISNSNYKKLINESDLINITEVEYYLKVQKIISDEIKKYTDVTNHDKFFESFSLACSYLLNLNAEFFDDKTQINIPINILEDKQVIDFLNFIDECQSPEVNYLNNALVISIGPMSDGEQAFIKLFSALFYGLTLNRYEEKRTAIILLDEPDKSMHPEWSRILLSEVMNFLKRLEEGYERYQIIITSHSPFVISDLPKENVIALDKHLTTGKCVIKKIEIEQTFANNIHSILIDKFFMTATIGEFALDKVNSVINRLVQKESLSEEETVESKYIISLVGDELIREKLVELFNDKIKFQREGNSR
ncbi:AAA family ATPase [Paenibacillus sp. RC67]|uniref:AAA family ATPase n=1 Tax=Paenibacillus sp. RC67 TaxID=3039392 RepID=UPI0024ACC868|nr:AAA family ATPase [Paenibacillus sp. RC67]